MMDQQTGASSDMKCRCILGVVFTLCDLIPVTIHVQCALPEKVFVLLNVPKSLVHWCF